jgi:phenylpyruvate tautomerase PptA (4-oxalocrotonate tautomerase family)
MAILSGIRSLPTRGAPARPRRRHHRPRAATARIYAVRHRVEEPRITYIPASELAATVTEWLAEVGACSPLVDALAQEVDANNWAAAHSIAECLGIEVTVAS